MAFIDRLRQELDRAGRQASRALDEGRLRLELYRAKQSADRFAQRFGYAVFRAKQAGNELPPEEVTAHMNNLTAMEAEIARLQTLISETSKERRDWLLDTRSGPSGPGPSGQGPSGDAGNSGNAGGSGSSGPTG